MKATIVKMSRIIKLLLICALLINQSAATTVDHCIVMNGTLPSEVILDNCETPPCDFYINGNSTMTLKFRSPRYLENFAPSVLAFALGVTVPYPLGQNDGCDGVTNTPCPLAENEYIEYTYSMFILPIFPPISFTIEFSLVDKDRNNEPFLCFRCDILLNNLP